MSNIPTCAVRSTVRDSVGGQPVAGATITARLSSYEIFEGFVVPRDIVAKSDANGEFVLNLFPNELGAAASFYDIKIISPTGKSLRTTAVVPSTTTVDLADISDVPPYEGKINVSLSEISAVRSDVLEAKIDTQAARDEAVPAAAMATEQATAATSAATDAASARGGAQAAEIAAQGYANTAQAAAGNANVFGTWVELEAVVGISGQGGQVIDDSGTHTDPVTSETVNNTGQYIWDVGVSAWKWMHGDVLAQKIDRSEVDARVGDAVPAKPSRVPVISIGAKVPLWIDDGLIAGVGVTPELGASILSPAAGLIDAASGRSAERVPLVRVGARIPIWLDDGAVGFSALTGGTLTYLAGALGGAVAPPAPIATSGATLRKYRAKTSKFRAGEANTQIRVGITGDSWTELSTIPSALVARLNAQYAQSASGLISFCTNQQTGGVTVVRSGGWTLADMTPAGGRSLGPDGMAIWTAGTDATIACAGIRGTQITLGYYDGTGSFRYRIDGGAWVPVVGTGTNATATLPITGLSVGPHSLDIDTTNNAGTMELYFALAEAPAVSGITLLKSGNGGSTGLQWTAAKTQIQQWSALLALDLLIVILGTNDSRASVPTSHPTTLAQGIADIVAAHRHANADVSVIYTFPPLHGEAVGPEPISEFRAAAEARCADLGIECYRAYAEWDDYATELARGMWAGDLYHLSASGGNRFEAGLHRNYLEI